MPAMPMYAQVGVSSNTAGIGAAVCVAAATATTAATAPTASTGLQANAATAAALGTAYQPSSTTTASASPFLAASFMGYDQLGVASNYNNQCSFGVQDSMPPSATSFPIATAATPTPQSPSRLQGARASAIDATNRHDRLPSAVESHYERLLRQQTSLAPLLFSPQSEQLLLQSQSMRLASFHPLATMAATAREVGDGLTAAVAASSTSNQRGGRDSGDGELERLLAAFQQQERLQDERQLQIQLLLQRQQQQQDQRLTLLQRLQQTSQLSQLPLQMAPTSRQQNHSGHSQSGSSTPRAAAGNATTAEELLAASATTEELLVALLRQPQPPHPP